MKEKAVNDSPKNAVLDTTDEEDITEHVYMIRHNKAELEEQARWRTGGTSGTGGQRGNPANAQSANAAAAGPMCHKQKEHMRPRSSE